MTPLQLALTESCVAPKPWPDYSVFPRLRYMGSKHRLMPWIADVVSGLEFDSALDAFSGSGCVSYMFKTLGKSVRSNDFLQFATDLTRATVENSHVQLNDDDIDGLLSPAPHRSQFIEHAFRGIFYSDEDNIFLDEVWAHLASLPDPKRQIALSALYRSCLKRVPRGVFTVAGLDRYQDGRRDLRLSLREHFVESVEVFNRLVFDNGQEHRTTSADVFELETDIDLVYLDPPYVPRSDDNCYIKRYHFLEGLSSYWSGAEFHPTSKVKKLKKRYTPFSYRREAEGAFSHLFEKFRESTIVLSYSSNGFPDLTSLIELLACHKRRVDVHERPHRYHFGTHDRVERSLVTEYLIVGSG